jgi:hypothetical protein
MHQELTGEKLSLHFIPTQLPARHALGPWQRNWIKAVNANQGITRAAVYHTHVFAVFGERAEKFVQFHNF